jgi:putative ABC transport system ATP-binding protein
MTEAIPAIQAAGLSKAYRRDRVAIPVFEDVGLELAAGETGLIRGPSGAGKTTLLGLLAGLARPDSGRVCLGGVELGGLDQEALAALRRERIGFVFQDFHLIESWTAVENVETVFMHGPVPRAERRERAAGLLAELGLGDRLGHRPGELSVGQRQRVALARALVHGPALILADEPAGAVDEATGRGMVGLMLGLAARLGAAVLVASHGTVPGFVPDRAWRLDQGRLSGDRP